MSSLKKAALHGAFWSFAERFGQQGVQFLIWIILARLLEPKDFGVLAMIMIFSALAQSVIESGFGMALIQKQDATHTDESTVFWFNIVVGVVMAGALYSAAPLIAEFYNTPLLTPITQVFSLNLIISSFGIVHNALLVKELAFKRRTKVVIVSAIVSGLVGIFMAFQGFGVWALIAYGLVMSGVRTAGLWMVHSWRPAFIFSGASFRTLWKFGSNLLFTGLLNTFFDNIYLVIIGKVYSVADLGFYQLGKRLMALTSTSLAQVISQVNFPLLSKIQDDPDRMRRAFSHVLPMTMLVILPIMLGLAAVAPNFIMVLLGEKWMPTVPYLQVFCIIGAFYPIHLLNVNVIMAKGHSNIVLRLEIIKKIIIILNIVINWQNGIMALLWGQVALNAMFWVINAFYVHRFIGYGLLAQFNVMKKILAASLLMVGSVWWGGQILNMLAYATLLLQVFSGGIVFITLLWLLREPVLKDVFVLISTKITRQKNE